MPRVVGCDPGSSSLDLLLLDEGKVAGQVRLPPDASESALIDTLHAWRPLDLVAGPSGYGLPLVEGHRASDRDLRLMSLVRPDEQNEIVGVGGFSRWVRALGSSDLPVVFMPGAILLPTVPDIDKLNTIDLGTPDKVAVAAFALRVELDRSGGDPAKVSFAVVEVGTVFTSILVVEKGQIVAAAAGTRGPLGLRSGGAWDGESAYVLSPLSKHDLFEGGASELGVHGPSAIARSVTYHLAGLASRTNYRRIWLSGSGLSQPDVCSLLMDTCAAVAPVEVLQPWPGVWVKIAAQGAALLADGLAGGPHQDLVQCLRLREASGTILDHLRPRRPEWI